MALAAGRAIQGTLQRSCWARTGCSVGRRRRLLFSAAAPTSRRAPRPRCAAQSAAASAQAPPTMRLVLVSAVALLNAQQQVLLAQRPAGKDMAGLWEFPGGKVEDGETPEAALVRELREELCIEVDEGALRPLTFASHTYTRPGGASFHLLMPVFVCSSWRGELAGAEGQALAWVGLQQLEEYDMPPADLPLLPAVRAAMQGLL